MNWFPGRDALMPEAPWAPNHRPPARWKAPLRWARDRLLQLFFFVIGKLARRDEARRLAAETLRGLLATPVSCLAKVPELAPSPYSEVARPTAPPGAAQRDDIVFITGRFRSGSTLLWNVFRHVPGCTAYYEPFHEWRWFDAQTREMSSDPTHRKVSEYRREYEGLDELGKYYHKEWTYRHLFMDPAFWDPDMKRYMEILISEATGRPVLQFNRIDFRLPWIRAHFPHARIVHLYRHPRDQWCSSLRRGEPREGDARLSTFARYDHFYLLPWARDLKYVFPFLGERLVSHPYELFYTLWRLSFLFGVRYADLSIAFEDLVGNPDKKLTEVFRTVNVEDYDLEGLKALIEAPSPGKWKTYADDGWFGALEETCERRIAEYFAALMAEGGR